MSKLIVAYHGYLYGDNYIPMMTEQFRKLVSTGLAAAADKIYVGLTAENDAMRKEGFTFVTYFLKDLDNVEIALYDNNKEEAETLQWISNYAKKDDDAYILYFHTKGITHYTEATEDWRKYMEYFVLDNYKDCIAKLDEGFDSCGVMWNTTTKFQPPSKNEKKRDVYPHYSGGMWWATTKYINRLDDSFLTASWRYYREFWIGSAESRKIHEFHNSRYNDFENLVAFKGHYGRTYKPIEYIKKDQVVHVICTVFKRLRTLQTLINSFLAQTSTNWDLLIVHDGEVPADIKEMVDSYHSEKIRMINTPKVNGYWGHPNRDIGINNLISKPDDYVLITNDDNYYVPFFVEEIITKVKPNVGMIYCDTLHSYFRYDVHKSILRKGHIDMGAFVVRFLVAKRIGFKSLLFDADGVYAEKCRDFCMTNNLSRIHIPKALFIHN